ncbi:lipid IV(A) 3-deoxy-D-manno-octulosonic acid transferase [Massilia sp. R2A-15]|uniref:lipid IV(A) 3-deoxy-D-manno-octulosonic acid transferase n=1 Tax=Massilia sp. R2A-15 TaxID=3064278 RepID=UPI0027364AC5|nr:lipid IV(A) 3-deoxy-D-manno-octulosonic acid transferase [Massilia sp. R2A-15]WLI88379.1 lipid IV(A) 3-deoxy-D-manno-octulosonic acid transferase [Massilia sp. R2A-15]
MNRSTYSLLWRLALPLVLGRLWWRGLREPGYRKHLGERLGHYGDQGAGWHTIWIHAVSVGETRAAEPLVDALMAAYPESRILMTHMTPTGRATGAALFARHGIRFQQSYLPYDLAPMVLRFMRHFTPRICILMETEVWPNLIAVCAKRGVPVALVNARLSERSLRRAGRFGKLMTDAARAITLVAAQTEDDARRVRSLGVPNVEVTGSIKFDVVVPPAAVDAGAALRGRIGARPVLLCASTRDGEEALILDAFLRMDARPAGMLLLIVPRHPQRFDDVAKMAQARGLALARRSGDGSVDADVQVMLGDSMGEMFAYFAASDCAFIGGSLLPLGGQNLIEACALGKPVLIGEHTFNFAQISDEAVEAGAARRVRDAGDMLLQASTLLDDGAARAAMGQRAAAFANRHRGATARTVELLRRHIY